MVIGGLPYAGKLGVIQALFGKELKEGKPRNPSDSHVYQAVVNLAQNKKPLFTQGDFLNIEEEKVLKEEGGYQTVTPALKPAVNTLGAFSGELLTLVEEEEQGRRKGGRTGTGARSQVEAARGETVEVVIEEYEENQQGRAADNSRNDCDLRVHAETGGSRLPHGDLHDAGTMDGGEHPAAEHIHSADKQSHQGREERDGVGVRAAKKNLHVEEKKPKRLSKKKSFIRKEEKVDEQHSATSDKKEDLMFIDVVNCGGRLPLAAMHRVHMEADQAASVLVFNGCIDLNTSPRNEDPRNTQSYLDYIEQWLTTAAGTTHEDLSNEHGATASATDRERPIVFLVATRLDESCEEKKSTADLVKEQVNRRINKSGLKRFLRIEGPLFIGNHPLGDWRINRESGVKKLQDGLREELKKKAPRATEIVRLSWLSAERNLVAKSNKKGFRGWMTVKEVREELTTALQSDSGDTSNEDTLSFLRYLRKHGVVRLASNVCLRSGSNITDDTPVFTSMNWLINQMEKVMESGRCDPSKLPQRLQEDHTMLKVTGKLTKQLLDALWAEISKKEGMGDVQESVRDIYQQLGLMYEIAKKGDVFFVPSHIPYGSSYASNAFPESSKDEPRSHLPDLLLQVNEKRKPMPMSVFHQAATLCMERFGSSGNNNACLTYDHLVIQQAGGDVFQGNFTLALSYDVAGLRLGVSCTSNKKAVRSLPKHAREFLQYVADCWNKQQNGETPGVSYWPAVQCRECSVSSQTQRQQQQQRKLLSRSRGRPVSMEKVAQLLNTSDQWLREPCGEPSCEHEWPDNYLCWLLVDAIFIEEKVEFNIEIRTIGFLY